jgi:hypothetical protein
MDRLRSIVVVAVSAFGLVGLGLLGVGAGSAGTRDERRADAASLRASDALGAIARACSAPLDGFCAIGVELAAHDGRRQRSAAH